jgi:hypothetical protein
MDQNSNIEQRILNLKELYESNNNVLISIFHSQSNLNSAFIIRLIDNISASNADIMRNITNLSVPNNIQSNADIIRNITNLSIPDRQSNYAYGNRSNYLNNPTIDNLFRTFFTPVEIYPTQSQIESATRVARFGDIVSPLNTTCPISLENFNENDRVLIIRHCRHVFSNSALISWFRSNCRCPVCRYDIRDLSYNSLSQPNNIFDLSNNNISSINVTSDNVTTSYRDISSNILPYFENNNERSSPPPLTDSITDLLSDLLTNSNMFNNNDLYTVTDVSGNLFQLFSQLG